MNTVFRLWVPGKLVLDLDQCGWLWTSSHLETITKIRTKSHPKWPPNIGYFSLSQEGICNHLITYYIQFWHSPNCITLRNLWASLLNLYCVFTHCSLHQTFTELCLSDLPEKSKPKNYIMIFEVFQKICGI